MIELKLQISDVHYYISDVKVHAFISKMQPEEHVEYYFSVSEPTAVMNFKTNIQSTDCSFTLMKNAVFMVMCEAKVYTIDLVDGNFVKIYHYSVTASKEVYPSSISSPYHFDTQPIPPQYDKNYLVSNNISYVPLVASLSCPDDISYELPYYIPFNCMANYGIPPYKYNWVIDSTYYVGSEAFEHPYDMFAKNNICSLAFTESGDYTIGCTVTDSLNHKVVIMKSFKVAPKPIIEPYKFDTNPRPTIYDGTIITYPSYTPPDYNFSKSINFYIGVYRCLVDVPDEQMGTFVSDIKLLSNRETNAPLFYERYNAAIDCYKHITSRASIYFPSRFNVNQIFKFTKNNLTRLGYNMNVCSDYSIYSAMDRLNQMFRFVAAIRGWDYITYKPNVPTYFSPIVQYNSTINGMVEYIYNKWTTTYSNMEWDEVYDMIQNDVHSYLATVNEFSGSVMGGLTGIS